VLACADRDVAVLLGRRELARVPHGVLQRGRALVAVLTDLARRCLDVGPLERRDDLVRGHLVGDELVRLQPDAHGVLLGAEDVCVADTLDALEHGEDVDVDEVVQKLLVELVVVTVDAQVHEHRVLFLRDLHAVADDLGRELTHHRVDAVLHVDRGDIGIDADLEEHLYDADAVVAGVAAHVLHARYAIDRALERHDGGLGHDLRVGAGVLDGDVDLGRGDARKQRHRQGRQREQPEQRDDDGDDRGHHRSSGERLHGRSKGTGASADTSGAIATICAPSFSRCAPASTMRSVGDSPRSSTNSLPTRPRGMTRVA
jgi:hypothetical protein